jgi:predicted transcriptional regulator
MRYWRLLCLIIFLFSFLLPVAIAQSGFEVSLENKPDTIYNQYSMSFWQLPDSAKLFYITTMSVAFLGFLKLIPFMLGKIDDLLKNENRHNILNYIYANPGTTIARISESQQIERGTVKYHLYKLESEGKIIFRRMGKFSRLFRNSGTFSDGEQKVIAHMQNRNSRAILQLIIEQPGITNQELTERLSIEKSAIHWHMEKFMSDGLVSFVADGKFKRYYVLDNAMVMLQKHTEQAVT